VVRGSAPLCAPNGFRTNSPKANRELFAARVAAEAAARAKADFLANMSHETARR
jgi:hypothetical protein